MALQAPETLVWVLMGMVWGGETISGYHPRLQLKMHFIAGGATSSCCKNPIRQTQIQNEPNQTGDNKIKYIL